MRIHNRRWPAALAGLSMLLTLPAQSHAALCDLFKCKKCQPAAAPALACNPCAQAQTVSYVPQTSYRCQSVTVPVTSYQPVVSSDPCSGCPVTSYKPVTSFVQQTRMVPFTSYRLVYSNRPCVTCAPVAATTTYIPSTTYVPTTNYVPQGVAPASYTAPAACPTCPGGSGPGSFAPGGSASYGAATAAPSLLTAPYGAPTYGAPSYGTPPYQSPSAMPSAPSGSAPPSYPPPGAPATFAPPPPAAVPAYGNAGSATSGYAATPAYNPAYPARNPGYAGSAPATGSSSNSSQQANPGNAPPATFQNNPPQNQAAPSGTQQLKPIPDQNMTPGSKVNSSSNLRLLDPENRTTSAPVYPAWAYTPVAWASAATQTSTFQDSGPQQPAETMPAAEDNLWRASNR